MRAPHVRVVALACAALLACIASIVADRTSPFPRAEVKRGSEEAFASGLQLREIPPGHAPQRWTTTRAVLRFSHLPPGPATLEVRLHGHRTPVGVSANGVILGVIEPGQTGGPFALDVPRNAVDVELRTDGFSATDGRGLGALLDMVSLVHGSAGLPQPRLVLCFVVPAVLIALFGLLAGLAPGLATVAAAAMSALQVCALHPSGVLRSGYAETLGVLLVAGGGLSLAFGHVMERGVAGRGRWAFVALLAAFAVQGVAATSPLMIVSDAVLHANKLMSVAGGHLFPTSLTQHAQPFRFPYGVSFYALLAPLSWAGLDPVLVVRAGAGAAGLVSSVALFVLVVELAPPSRAALAVLVLQLLPSAFDVYSYGNLSNVFGQAMSVAFFAWWAGRAAGGWTVGALLLGLGCLAHLSSLVVLITLGSALVLARGAALRRDAARMLALAAGLSLALVYYAQFFSLVLEQLPRLGEGGGRGEVARSMWDVFASQLARAGREWGIPAVLLALAGLPRALRPGVERDLFAFWMAGIVLAVVAAISPLEVRYIYALTLPLAVAVATGFDRLRDRRGVGGAVAWGLLAWQAILGLRAITEGVLYRYRS